MYVIKVITTVLNLIFAIILIKQLSIDNFAGGGGASTGIEMATGISVDIAINHDPEAIKMHKANLPEMCKCERTGNMKIETEQTGQLRFA